MIENITSCNIISFRKINFKPVSAWRISNMRQVVIAYICNFTRLGRVASYL